MFRTRYFLSNVFFSTQMFALGLMFVCLCAAVCCAVATGGQKLTGVNVPQTQEVMVGTASVAGISLGYLVFTIWLHDWVVIPLTDKYAFLGLRCWWYGACYDRHEMDRESNYYRLTAVYCCLPRGHTCKHDSGPEINFLWDRRTE